MNRRLEYTITPAEAGKKIEEYLRLVGYSRYIITGLKKDSLGILLNGEPSYANVPMKEGDNLVINIEEKNPSCNIQPTPMILNILYEDQDILVLNKPADMPIHPSMGNYINTLANGVVHYYEDERDSFCYRCINRLDRDTTGVLVIAKNPLSGAVLSDQMTNREIHRTYLAVVEGTVEKEGTIDAPIAREEGSVITRCVSPQGERAITHYRPLVVNGGFSMVELHLETGRTHQIRVHMKYIGHPLPGDYLYYPNYEVFQRQPLHSWQLEFAHPITKEKMNFKAPLPEDIKKTFNFHTSLI